MMKQTRTAYFEAAYSDAERNLKSVSVRNIWISKLTVGVISSVNMEKSQFVFLSASSVAENAFRMLMDEPVHLNSGFQLAGFLHVTASLWQADDSVSAAVAKKFYQIILAADEITGHDGILYALHDAIPNNTCYRRCYWTRWYNLCTSWRYSSCSVNLRWSFVPGHNGAFWDHDEERYEYGGRKALEKL